MPPDIPTPPKCPSQNSQGESSPLPTALAHVGLLPGVLAHVGNEGARLGEGFPADQALARLLSWGKHRERVGGEQEGRENPSGRQERIRTGVDADVALERAGVGELALAVHAHVRLLPAVDPQVPLQVTWEQGRLKDTGSSPPFSSFPVPQKLPQESLLLLREQGLRRDQGKSRAPCLGSGNNVEGGDSQDKHSVFEGIKRLHWDHPNPLALQQVGRRREETFPSPKFGRGAPFQGVAPWGKPGIHAAQPGIHGTVNPG